MLKLLIFLFGLAAGGGGVTAWMLSEPEAPAAARPVLERDSLEARLAEVKARFNQALQEGEAAGRQTEERLRRELAAYRKDPNRGPAA